MSGNGDHGGAADATIRVTCRLFGRYAEASGLETVALDLPWQATAADAVSAVRARMARADLLPSRPLVAVNQRHAFLDHHLADGDEVALLPPLAGGCR